MTVHTNHTVFCDLCPAQMTVPASGQANDVALRGWLVVVLEPVASAGSVRTHVCSGCVAASPALVKLAEPLGPIPVISKEMLS